MSHPAHRALCFFAQRTEEESDVRRCVGILQMMSRPKPSPIRDCILTTPGANVNSHHERFQYACRASQSLVPESTSSIVPHQRPRVGQGGRFLTWIRNALGEGGSARLPTAQACNFTLPQRHSRPIPVPGIPASLGWDCLWTHPIPQCGSTAGDLGPTLRVSA